ncbi:hypothetical protein PRZ48_014233 [Zasmidium cellare]|uniref:Uncharacterized protein n=1 Tax=Zasmidium cellare TaxID=395010 RepID=A0ABR0E0C8_ZASCE|nr:hypothetical protein PRZ48_014233 [Zasmidium cellare]
MLASKQLAAAFAAFSALTTSLAAPSLPRPYDIVPGLALPLRDTAEPPSTACTVQPQGHHDVYGVTVPVPHSDKQCFTAHSAISEYTAGFNQDWVCQPYGDWTILIFSSKTDAADNINEAFRRVYTGFTFQCADNHTVETSSLVARDLPAVCTLFEGEPDSYSVMIPTAYPSDRCNTSEAQLAPYIDDSTWNCLVYGTVTGFKFDAPDGVTGQINEQLTQLYPTWDLLCGEPPKKALEKTLTCIHSYNIWIGETYDPSDCDDFFQLLRASEFGLQRYSCKDDGEGMTFVWFQDTSKLVQSRLWKQAQEERH